MTQCSYKNVVTNNKYMNEQYDETKPSNYINYLDANHFYGLVMCQKLPFKNFKWHYSKIDDTFLKCSDGDDVRYILKADLKDVKEPHGLHNDYPLAPEIMKSMKIWCLMFNNYFIRNILTRQVMRNKQICIM